MFVLILAVLFVLFVLECVFTEVEHFGWATVTLIATAIGSAIIGHWFPEYSVLTFVKAHGVFTAVYAVAYVGVGVAWSFVKWFSYLMSFRDAFREQKEAFCKKNNLDSREAIPEDKMAAFDQHISHVSWTNNHRSQLLTRERPRASKNKARITAWAAFWPFSFLGTLLNDPVRRIFNFLFNQFKALYQKMSDWVFRKDLELK